MRPQLVSPLALLLFAVSSTMAFSQELVGDREARAAIEVRDLTRTEDGVSGVIVNLVPRELRDVRVLVQLVYHWPDEMHPGPESPSDAAVVTLAGPIPPGGSTPFRVAVGPRPDVAAGPDEPKTDFEIRASVIGWSEVGEPAIVPE